MDASRTFRHLEYALVCSAKPANNGQFSPALVVVKQVWPTRPRVIAMQRGDYPTQETAIDAAYTQGVEWVLNYG